MIRIFYIENYITDQDASEEEIVGWRESLLSFDSLYPSEAALQGCVLLCSLNSYQNGPDTYLLQLRDVDFPSRLRRYMQVASSRSPMFALKLRQDPWIGSVRILKPGVVEMFLKERSWPFFFDFVFIFQYSKVTVKERRRFQDVNDEEIDDERRAQKLRGPGMSGSSASSSIPRRIRLEVGSGMGDLKREAEVYREQKWEGQVRFPPHQSYKGAVIIDIRTRLCRILLFLSFIFRIDAFLQGEAAGDVVGR
jgi:hypothetical protein